jgi:hypothetical protein
MQRGVVGQFEISLAPHFSAVISRAKGALTVLTVYLGETVKTVKHQGSPMTNEISN